VNLTTLRQALTEDRITTETITDARADRAIASAVREYSRYNPRVLSVTLSTIANQAEYSLAAYSALGVRDAFWWPGGSITAELLSGSEQVLSAPDEVRYHMPSDRVINNINQSALIAGRRGRWELNGQSLKIFPTPTSNGTDDLEVWYTALHLINAGGTGYDTIPFEDQDIVADLSAANYLRGRLAEMAMEADYAEGAQSITKHYTPANIAAAIAVFTQSARAKYNDSGLAVVR